MILKSKLNEIMNEENPKKVEFANMLGISRVTLDNLLNNKWEQIQRQTIIKLCQHLGKDIGDIFYLEEETIWERIKETGKVHIIVGGRATVGDHTVEGYEYEKNEGIYRVALGYWDMLAWSELLQGLRHIVPERFTVEIQAFPVRFNEEIDLSDADKNRVQSLLNSGDTCIIIGSPKTNPVFSFCYKAIYEMREKTPEAKRGDNPRYLFKWVPPPDMKETKKSFGLQAVKCPSEQGIYRPDKDDTLPVVQRNVSRQKINHDLPDAGVILLGLDYENSNTTVIGLGGWGGPGTVGCVRALKKQTEDLDHLVQSSSSKSVIKPVFVRFRKPTDTPIDDRRVSEANVLIKDHEFGEAMQRARELIEN